jgi:serine/threonine protein kinase
MATLQVRGPDWSATKQKALEDAKKMQAAVNEQSMKDGKELPPYMLTELIGKGSFGRVYKATDVKRKSLVAVKIIDIEESDTLNPKLADTFREFMAEVNALKLLSDSGARNINHVIDALPVGQSMWMITEYCAGGSVATLMRPTAPGGLQERWIVPILREVAEAVFWVHRQGIIHRDIKCANVLITESGGVQLCDFGVAGVIETKFDKRSTFIGTPHWMAPELFDRDMSYGTEVDIWAFGSMVYEIASGLPPNVMAGIDVYQLGNYIKSHVPRLEGDQYSDQLKSLVAFCLMEDPRQRPTIEQVQAHPYIMNSAQRYPTSSLSLLVRGYKLWESQGGARKSLFAPGGAQGLADISDLSSTALANDEWNFSTTLAFDQEVFEDPDGQAVFDVYGTNVDFDPSEMFRPNNSKPKGRRRPPPQALAAMRAPLEKVFDPNTISNYEDNARAYYGMPVPPPVSDLPLRDESSQSADVRESLIDLDASLNGSDLSRFVDMDTIRAGEPRMSVDYYGDPEDSEFNRPPLSDPADLNPNRRTQDWKFPSFGPASANPEMSKFPTGDTLSVPSPANRPGLQHSATDPVQAPNYGPGDFTFPRPSTQASSRESVSSLIDLDMGMPEQMGMHEQPSSRESISSLIDLDMSMPEPTPDSTRPSTANSDAASVSGSEMGMANPFDLERHASLYIPSSNREPSIYVSDDSDFASAIPKANDAFANGLAGLAISESSRSGSAMSNHSRPNGSIGSSTGSSTIMMPPPPPLRVETGFNPTDYADEPEDSAYLTPQTSRGPFDGSTPTAPNIALNGRSRSDFSIPSAPAPPQLQVMQGQADPEMVKAELRRMTMSLGEHLTLINQHLSSLPVRDAGYDDSNGMQ